MDILTFFTPAEMSGVDYIPDAVIIFDVLRGATTISSAFKAGASRIVPVADLGEAKKLSDKIGRANVLLCGSANCEKIDGFDLSGSPLEIKNDNVTGKAIIYLAVNISQAIRASQKAGRILLGCFNNMQAVLESVGHPKTLHLVCAGKMGRFSFEDAVCAGMFVQLVVDSFSGEIGLNDASSTARFLYYRHHRDIEGMLRQSSQGHHLTRLGLDDDLEFAAQISNINIVPELSLDKSHLISTVVLENVY